MTLTGAPATNPVTGARRYTGAEFVIRLWLVNRTGMVDLAFGAPIKPTHERAGRRMKR